MGRHSLGHTEMFLKLSSLVSLLISPAYSCHLQSAGIESSVFGLSMSEMECQSGRFEQGPESHPHPTFFQLKKTNFRTCLDLL